MREITASQTIRPASPAMSLDVGRFSLVDAARFGLLALCSLAVSAVGAAIFNAALPGLGDELGGFRLVGLAFGFAVAGLGLAFAGLVGWLMVTEWLSHRARLQEWHEVTIRSYDANGGREVSQTVTQWDVLPSVPLHVIGAALAVHRQVQAGKAAPWSVRSLEGPVFLGRVRLGDVSPSVAEQLPKVFAQVGLVDGRGPRSAGSWVPADEAQLVRMVVENWHKVRN